ncbi:hypothetical protein Tco_0267191 [Tanacetum coccineum]
MRGYPVLYQASIPDDQFYEIKAITGLHGSTKRRDCIAEDIGVLLPHQVDWLCYCIFLKKMNAWCTQFCTQQRHNMETKHNMPIVPPQPSQSR